MLRVSLIFFYKIKWGAFASMLKESKIFLMFIC